MLPLLVQRYMHMKIIGSEEQSGVIEFHVSVKIFSFIWKLFSSEMVGGTAIPGKNPISCQIKRKLTHTWSAWMGFKPRGDVIHKHYSAIGALNIERAELFNTWLQVVIWAVTLLLTLWYQNNGLVLNQSLQQLFC